MKNLKYVDIKIMNLLEQVYFLKIKFHIMDSLQKFKLIDVVIVILVPIKINILIQTLAYVILAEKRQNNQNRF